MALGGCLPSTKKRGKMNQTDLLNTTAGNITQNETVKQTLGNAGSFGLDKLLNMQWTEGVAAWLNSMLGTNAFTGSTIALMLPVITLVLLWWKWGAAMQFLDTVGKTILLLAIIFVVLKALGVL